MSPAELALSGLLIVGLVISGCSSAGADAPATPTSAASALAPSGVSAAPGGMATAGDGAVSFPIQAPPEPSLALTYQTSTEIGSLAYKLWQAAADQCMATKGFDEYIPVPDADPDAFEYHFATTPEEVAQFGYGYPGPGRGVTPNTGPVANTPEFLQAAEGCDELERSEGSKVGLTVVQDQVREGLASALERSASSPEMQTLDQAWSTCMSEAGYSFQNPMAAVEQFSAEETSSGEVAARVADLTCQAQLSYALTESQIKNSFVKAWAEENPTLIQEWQESYAAYTDDLANWKTELGL